MREEHSDLKSKRFDLDLESQLPGPVWVKSQQLTYLFSRLEFFNLRHLLPEGQRRRRFIVEDGGTHLDSPHKAVYQSLCRVIEAKVFQLRRSLF